MMLYGCGQMIGSFFLGAICTEFGLKKAALINLFIMIANVTASVFFLYTFKFNWTAFAMSFFWGL